MNSNTIFEIASMVYLQDVQLDVCVCVFIVFSLKYIYIFYLK